MSSGFDVCKKRQFSISDRGYDIAVNKPRTCIFVGSGVLRRSLLRARLSLLLLDLVRDFGVLLDLVRDFGVLLDFVRAWGVLLALERTLTVLLLLDFVRSLDGVRTARIACALSYSL